MRSFGFQANSGILVGKICNKNVITMTLTFNQLRKIKDSLPDGTMHKIAEELGVTVETVRNYFGGANFERGESADLHIQPGPDGGIVQFSDLKIFKMAQDILAKEGKLEEVMPGIPLVTQSSE